MEFHTHTRFELLLDEYIAASPGGILPESWGFSANSRRFNATLLANFSRSPDLLKPLSANLCSETDTREDRARQVLFAKLFAGAPNYFLSFVAYFRDTATAKTKIGCVAQMILAEGDRLLVTPDGRKRDDKEIADILEARGELYLSPLHPSFVGKARKLISEWCAREEANRFDRHAESLVLFREWLEELRSANGVSDKLPG